jgi:hypothetical protein
VLWLVDSLSIDDSLLLFCSLYRQDYLLHVDSQVYWTFFTSSQNMDYEIRFQPYAIRKA